VAGGGGRLSSATGGSVRLRRGGKLTQMRVLFTTLLITVFAGLAYVIVIGLLQR
jgi:hypothetical protein